MGKSTTKESKKAQPIVAVKETPSKSSKKSKKEVSSDSESSSSEEEESFSEISSESESEDEKPSKKESKKAKKAKKKEESESSESESKSEDEKPAKKEKPKKEESSESSESESESSDSDSDSKSESESSDSDSKSESETEKEEKKDDPSDSDSSDSSDSDSSNSDSEEEEKKEAPKEESKKRKAEDNAQEETAKKSKTEEGSCTLFVGKLSWNLDDESLKAGFMHLPGVVSARVVTHKDSGRSRGFGYVDFDTPENAKNAMEQMQGSELDGRPIAIDLSTQRPVAGDNNRAADRAKRHGDVTSPESDTLFVGNLPFEISQDEVREFFAQSAEPAGVRLPTDPESGNLKGFGYVSFNSVDDARKAFTERNGDYLGPGRAARAVRLDYASARPPREGGGRGGFGGRGGGRGGSRSDGGRGRGRGGFGGFGGRGGRGSRGGSRIDVSAATGANKITFDD